MLEVAFLVAIASAGGVLGSKEVHLPFDDTLIDLASSITAQLAGPLPDSTLDKGRLHCEDGRFVGVSAVKREGDIHNATFPDTLTFTVRLSLSQVALNYQCHYQKGLIPFNNRVVFTTSPCTVYLNVCLKRTGGTCSIFVHYMAIEKMDPITVRIPNSFNNFFFGGSIAKDINALKERVMEVINRQIRIHAQQLFDTRDLCPLML